MWHFARDTARDPTCAGSSTASYAGCLPRTLWRRPPCSIAPQPIGDCPELIPYAALGRRGMTAERVQGS